MTAKTLKELPRGLPTEEVEAEERLTMTRPRKYDIALAEEIIEHVAQGGSVRGVCREREHLPSQATFHRWVLEDDGLAERYRTARMIQARGLADDLIAIADDESGDLDSDGRPNHAKVQRDKLRLHARQWILGRVLPKDYGDRTQVEHVTGQQQTLDLDRLTADERATLQALLAKATATDEPGPRQVKSTGGDPIIDGPTQAKDPIPTALLTGGLPHPAKPAPKTDE